MHHSHGLDPLAVYLLFKLLMVGGLALVAILLWVIKDDIDRWLKKRKRKENIPERVARLARSKEDTTMHDFTPPAKEE